MKDVGVVYDRFLDADNDVAFRAWGGVPLHADTTVQPKRTRDHHLSEEHRVVQHGDGERHEAQQAAAVTRLLRGPLGCDEEVRQAGGHLPYVGPHQQVGPDVVPLDLHDLLCERLAQENDLIMLIAFDYVEGVRGVRACLRREASMRCAGAYTQ